MTVNTGIWRQSGTTACISIVINGSEGNSDVIHLNRDSKAVEDRKGNPLFDRGNMDRFIICVEKSFGSLKALQVAHDNSGKNPSWYLEDIEIKDTETNHTDTFECRSWFALEKDDGLIERILVPQSKGRVNFKNEFYSKTSDGLTDGHVWFSVLGKHPKNHFTRAQRASCCLLLLYSAMLASAMFYQEGATEQPVHVGPFKFTWREIIVSVQSAIVIAPITVLVVTIFRKSKPRATQRNWRTDRVSRPSREKGENGKEKQKKGKGKQKKGKGKQKKGKGKQPYPLPHWCKYIAWALCILASITAALFVVFYSLQFGKEKSNRWLTAVVLSCTQDILVSQPLRLLCVAVFIAYIRAKRAAMVKIPPEDSEGTNFEPISLLSLERTEKAREHQKLQQQMFAVLKEAILFIFFLLLLLAVCFGARDGNQYYMTYAVDSAISNFEEVQNTGPIAVLVSKSLIHKNHKRHQNNLQN